MIGRQDRQFPGGCFWELALILNPAGFADIQARDHTVMSESSIMTAIALRQGHMRSIAGTTIFSMDLAVTTKMKVRMNKWTILVLFSTVLPLLADSNSVFEAQFDGIVGDRLDLRFFHDGPYCPDIYSRKAGAERMLTAFSSMSNNVDEAVSMIPSVLTNDVRRNAFLSMAGHSGTNVFFRVWEALLDIAETNAVAASPALIDDFRCAATTPLYEYATFHFDLPVCQVLLARTRDLFSTNDPRHIFLVDVISGEEKRRSTEYYLTSGEGLPWFAQ